jgi:hypothetical protein
MILKKHSIALLGLEISKILKIKAFLYKRAGPGPFIHIMGS